LDRVGLDWQLGGFAVDPSIDDSSVGQLVQAMASFGGRDAADGLNTVSLGADVTADTSDGAARLNKLPFDTQNMIRHRDGSPRYGRARPPLKMR